MPKKFNGGLIGPRNTPSTGAASGRWTIPEHYEWTRANAWPGLGVSATGGTLTTITGFKVHTFTTSGTFTVNSGAGTVEYLVIAGGAGGGGTGELRSCNAPSRHSK